MAPTLPSDRVAENAQGCDALGARDDRQRRHGRLVHQDPDRLFRTGTEGTRRFRGRGRRPVVPLPPLARPRRSPSPLGRSGDVAHLGLSLPDAVLGCSLDEVGDSLVSLQGDHAGVELLAVDSGGGQEGSGSVDVADDLAVGVGDADEVEG